MRFTREKLIGFAELKYEFCLGKENRRSEQIKKKMIEQTYPGILWETPEKLAEGRTFYEKLVALLRTQSNQTCVTNDFTFHFDPKCHMVTIQSHDSQSGEYFLGQDGKGYCSDFNQEHFQLIINTLRDEHELLLSAVNRALDNLRQHLEQIGKLPEEPVAPIDATPAFAALARQFAG
jgi:hypothetical protein